MIEMHPVHWLMIAGACLCIAVAAFPNLLSAIGIVGTLTAASMALILYTEPRMNKYWDKFIDLIMKVPN